jgi:hypothetical protein
MLVLGTPSVIVCIISLLLLLSLSVMACCKACRENLCSKSGLKKTVKKIRSSLWVLVLGVMLGFVWALR